MTKIGRSTLLLLGLAAIVITLALFQPITSRAATWRVSESTGSDATGDGSQSNPWESINYAVSQAAHGDTIMVAGGAYDGEFLIWITKRLNLLGGHNPNGWERNVPVFRTTVARFRCDVNTEITIDGFVVESWADGIGFNEVQVLNITNNIIRNSQDGMDFVLPDAWWDYQAESIYITNNLIYNNQEDGIVNYWNDEMTVESNNNTIVNNNRFGVIGSQLPSIETKIRNDIIAFNSNEDLEPSAEYTVNYSDIGDQLYPGAGNISQDPLFIDPARPIHGIQSSSPCRNGGDPNSIYNDLDGTRNDMGFTGGPNSAFADRDYDGLPDSWEIYYCYDPDDPADASSDADNDFDDNRDEYYLGTNPGWGPGCPDTDGDGLFDSVENAYCTNPTDPDTDNDGLCDGSLSVGATCSSGEDMNNDGDVDSNETDPCDPDTDCDGLEDGQEASYGADPLDWDSDNDDLPDGFEADNISNPGGPLDPSDNSDAPLDFDGDGNSNVNEFWNGSDPWSADPVPNPFLNPACYFWGDGDGDGVVGPGDLNMLELEVAGVPQVYDDVIPTDVFDTMDLDKDGVPGPGDISMLEMMISGADRPAGYDSSPTGLSVVYAPPGPVADGATTHVTIAVDNDALAVPNSGAFAVVFWIDPASTGDAVLLGGDGEDLAQAFTNRYDISQLSTAGGLANIVLKITAPGPITINAKIPACGTEPEGRWAAEVVLNPPVVITGEP